jgi:sulfoxide reductase heme-binding subunit YedZ
VKTLNQLIRRLPAWPVYLVVAALIGWHFYQALTGAYRPDPVRALEWEYGRLALQFLIATLALTPLKRFTGLNLLKFRRALGLASFFFALAHLAVWVVLDMQFLFAQMLSDIVKRPYITLGMAALLLMLPLALTSHDRLIRRLGGARWRRLHRLIYPLAPLAALHFVLVRKGFQIEPLVYAGIILLLLALRLRLPRMSAPPLRAPERTS